MSRYRQIRDEEPRVRRHAIDPFEDPRHCRLLVDAEARLAAAADVARIGQHLESAVADDGVHPEVSEASRMEQSRAVRSEERRVGKECGSSGPLTDAGGIPSPGFFPPDFPLGLR